MPNRDVHYAIDVGSIPRKNFAWLCSRPGDFAYSDLEAMAQAMGEDLQSGRKVTLGFECPLFWPCPDCTDELGKQRDGDAGRGWSAGAGATVTPTGIQTLAWLLRAVAAGSPGVVATTSWSDFLSGRVNLLIWEAFASNKPGKMADDYDAKAIVQAFLRWVECGNGRSQITAPHPVSLAGMAILWAELSQDLCLLHEPCVVVKVDYGGRGEHPPE